MPENLSNAKQERKYMENSIKAKAKISIVIGVLIIIINFILSLWCQSSNWPPFYTHLCESLSEIFNIVTSIIIGMGISTLVLDFFGYIKYARDRIREVMLEKDYIVTLSDNEKRQMIRMAEESLYFKNGQVIDNSLYTNIKDQIIPLLEKDYIRQYKVHVDCFIDEARQVLIKKIHKSIEVVTTKDKNVFMLPFSTYQSTIPGFKNEELYSIELCKLNDKDVTNDVRNQLQCHDTIDEEDQTNIRFVVNYDFVLNGGRNLIEVKTKTTVPINDNTYGHTITIPCMRYSINFSVHDNNYDILGFAFALDAYKGINNLNKVIYRNKYDNCFKIRFENWTLPGDGCVFIVNKKSSDRLGV